MIKLNLILVLLFSYSILMSQPCLPEGIVFSTQAEIDNFQTNYPGCTEIEGNLKISGSDITNLDGLSVLTSIGGDLEIKENPLLYNLTGFENLTKIEGDLGIRRCDTLTSLAGLDNINPASIDRVNINHNHLLTECSIASICDFIVNYNGSLYVESNGSGCNLPEEVSEPCMTPPSCLLYGITFTSQFSVDNFTLLYPDCSTIEGDVRIMNDDITNLDGLSVLNIIGGDLKIYNADLLESLYGLNNLVSIGGDLEISFNDILNDISALENIDLSTIDDIEISHNDSLSNCALENFCMYLVDSNKVFRISSNSPGCNNTAQIADTCLLPDGCLLYGITLSTQEEIDKFNIRYPNCIEISGNIEISGDDITNLDGLSQLTSCKGDLTVRYNLNLTNLTGLRNITSIGKSLSIRGNPLLAGLDGLNKLTVVGKDIEIHSNNSLISLAGFEHLSSVGGRVIIFNNQQLQNLVGLHHITGIEGGIRVADNDGLHSLIGLNNVRTMNNSLEIADNHALITLAGLASLTTLGEGAIWIYDNPSLMNIDDIRNIDPASIDGLAIYGNTSLSNCAVESICAYLENPNGFTKILWNAPGCINYEEVQENCPLTIENTSTQNYLTIAPNPFSGNTILTFNSARTGSITINTFMPSGIRVQRLDLPIHQPGQQEIALDLSDDPPGIYILRMNIANKIITRKMVKY